jgi:hypothetical protein
MAYDYRRRLKAKRLTGRDVAKVMEVSPGRVSQRLGALRGSPVPAAGLESRGLAAVTAVAQAAPMPWVVGVHAPPDQLALVQRPVIGLGRGARARVAAVPVVRTRALAEHITPQYAEPEPAAVHVVVPGRPAHRLGPLITPTPCRPIAKCGSGLWDAQRRVRRPLLTVKRPQEAAARLSCRVHSASASTVPALTRCHRDRPNSMSSPSA